MASAQPLAYGEFVQRILRLYSTGKHAHATLTRVDQVLREVAALGPATTADLTTDLFARYVAAKGPGANPNTLNGLLSTAASVCSHAVDEGWLDRRPNWRRLRPRGRPMTKNAPRSYGEITGLLGHLLGRRCTWEGHRLCALVWLHAMTGVRLREALYARVEDLALGPAPALAVVPERQRRKRLKTAASARSVPLPETLAEVLRGWSGAVGSDWLFPGVRLRGPWDGGSDSSRPIGHLKAAAAEVGIPSITWHSLRHAFGTYALEQWGLPVWVVQRVMGHTDPRTTQRYLHLDGSPRIAEAMRGVSYRLPPAA